MFSKPTRRFGLSKSKITAFEQCPRRLWQQVHAPERAVQDEGAEERVSTGHAVGELACALSPGGVMVNAVPDLSAAVAETTRLIEAGHPGPIFEATFQHDGVLVRADILERGSADGWRMFEVKSSTSAKDYHRGDLATQIWVVREAGVKLEGAAIRHIDSSFVLETEGNYTGIFADAELLDELADAAKDRPVVAASAREMLSSDEPDIEPGIHCEKPFPCEFAAWCTRNRPEGPEWPVTILPRGGGKTWLAKGIENLLDLKETDLNERNARVLAATRDDKPWHDPEGARATMAKWGWPRAWLDFETIGPAIPLWLGTRPFQQVPFQFSLHLEREDGMIEHHEFLDISVNDPRSGCAEALVRLIPEDATIVAYNAGFEIRVLRELARAFPALSTQLNVMADRTVDLLPVARNHWYHRDQRGSWSIKAVLPSMGLGGYDGMEVGNGGEAQAAWREAADPATTPERREELAEGLRAYCKQDTWAMIAVARTLIGESPSA